MYVPTVEVAWLLLLGAAALEVVWAIGLKWSGGLSAFWPSVGVYVIALISFLGLGYAVRTLPVGTAYAVWTGIGAAGTALLGIWFFGESANVMRLVYISLIIIGVAGLKFGG